MTAQEKQALFYDTIAPLEKVKHADFGLKKISRPYGFAENTQAVPVTISELASAATNFPVIFVGDNHRPAAALAMGSGRNLFVSDQGQWLDNTYVPVCIRRYPFIVASAPDNPERMFFCIDEDAEQITEQSPDTRFFENGEATKFTQATMQHCEQYERDFQTTNMAMDKMQEFDLFCVKTLTYGNREASKESQVQFTAIDENKFKALDDSRVIEMRKLGLLDVVYAHLFSLANWNRLIALHNSRTTIR